MKITCTKQTWTIKVNDVHKRFDKHLPHVDYNNDAELIQYAIWFASEELSDIQAKAKLRQIWKSLIHGYDITIL